MSFLTAPQPAGSATAASSGNSANDHAQHVLDDPAEWMSFGKPLVSTGAPSSSVMDPARVPVWESHIVLEGMYCATCAFTIEAALRAVPGVQHAEVSAATHRARVVWAASEVKPSQWMAAVRSTGYGAVPAQDAQARQLRQAANRKALWRWLLATFVMMQVMMYAWPAYDRPDDLVMEMETLLRWASWVICIPMMIWCCGPFFRGAWGGLKQKRISMDLPVVLGMVITFVISSLGTFNPEGMFGREVFYDSLVMFVCFLLTGRWLEMRLRERTAGALDAVLNRLPESIEQQQADGSFVRVALRCLGVGDVIRVLPGEAFPADGEVLQGRSQADEALLTGESRPISKAVGDMVIAGSYNLSAPLQVQIKVLGADTKFAQIVDLMESAGTQKPRLAQLADKVAGPFLVAVLLLAAGAAAYWWGDDPGHALMVAATVLIVTCPCALSLATPVAMLTAAGTLARQGVLVRQLQGLESLAGVDTVVFDKTGTLTQDGMSVSASYSREAGEALQWQAVAAAVAQQSMHPVSRAVAAWGAPHAGAWQVLELEEISGQGLRAQVALAVEAAADAERDALGGATACPPHTLWVRLGSAAFAAGQGAVDAAVDSVGKAPHWMPCDVPQAVFLGLENEANGAASSQLVAAFALHEGVRPEAAAVVQALQAQGIDVQLLSGDAQAAVQRVAQQVGIAQAYAACSPQDKLAHLQALQAKGHLVAMVGDGLNDGPVLAGAHVSFAFGRAVPLAQSRSDFVVLGDNLGLVLRTAMFSRKTLRVVRQNLWWSAAYNAVSVPFAVVGLMPPWLAGLGMALSSLLVVLNAARLARMTAAQWVHPLPNGGVTASACVLSQESV